MRAQGISAWSYGDSSKSIISLDLDLYEKCYMLVNSREDMRDKYILRLGELHAVFAYIRAIGALIVCSGMEDAWLEAEWFDSESVIRQVLECKHMKRAVEAHEASMLTITILQLMEMLRTYPEYFLKASMEIIELINNANQGLSCKDNTEFNSSFFKLKTLLVEINFKDKWNEFQMSKVKNMQFRFFTVYCNMVKRLLEFIEASRARNWRQHLSSVEALMQDFISMDRCKYRKCWMVYIAGMKNLEFSNPEVWKYFLQGNFSVQKSNIVGTAIGCDHAGEQVNCEDKSRGGLKGISRNDNSRTRHYLAAPVISKITEQLLEQGQVNKRSTRTHHQVSKPYVDRQNDRILKLLTVLQHHDLGLAKEECSSIKNLITDNVFEADVAQAVVNCEQVGNEIYDQMVLERLQPGSTIGVFDPIKKVQLKTFKQASKK